MRRTAARLAALTVALLAASIAASFAVETAGEGAPRASLEVDAVDPTVGGRLLATLTVELPPELDVDPRPVGPALGRFVVLDGGWEPLSAETTEAARRRIWRGTIAAYETGELELPSINVALSDGSTVTSAPLSITIGSVLDDSTADAEDPLADIKPPASVPADYGPLLIALGIVALLLVVAAVLVWLHRRYGRRFAAVPVPPDPFGRLAPHEWVYRELRGLLDRRLPEQGLVDQFYAELSQIVKRYLAGRYRVDLLERTTAEVGDALRAAGMPVAAQGAALDLLERCDRVKFAAERPGSEAWRVAVESTYALVDATKPAARTEPARVEGAA